MITKDVNSIFRSTTIQIEARTTAMLTDYDADPDAVSSLNKLLDLWFFVLKTSSLTTSAPSLTNLVDRTDYNRSESRQELNSLQEKVTRNFERLCKIHDINYQDHYTQEMGK